MLKSLLVSLAFVAMASADAVPVRCGEDELGRRGCCSHHNGVCGCNRSTGMLRCCDGTDSPSCECEG